jgi:hypothetical protein
MKTWVLMLALVCAVATPVVAGPVAGTEKPWFDMQNCPICKSMTAETGLMEHMTWNTYLTATGMMGVCNVDPKYKDAYMRANTKMMAVVKDLEAGKDVGPLCGFCTSYTNLMKAGAKSETFPTASGDIMLLTSTDPAVIDQIHTHAQRTIDEYKKMSASMKAGAGK